MLPCCVCKPVAKGILLLADVKKDTFSCVLLPCCVCKPVAKGIVAAVEMTGRCVCCAAPGLLVTLCAWGTAVGGVVASRALFSDLLVSLLRCPLSFYMLTPVGRVLNRCCEDVAEVDYVVPFTLRSMVNCVLLVMGTVGMIVYATPLAACPLPLPALGYFIIQVGAG